MSPSGPANESELLETVAQLLADPAYDNNPLREPMAQLLELSTGQRERLERLIRISDGFHEMAREDHRNLAERSDAHLRRLERLVRISDRYQESLRELTESLQEAALHDHLTGLANRRFLSERLDAEIERAGRSGTPLTIALMDIDHFKAVNDRYGHACGDRVLCGVARTITESLREYDLCGRWGGEEFLLILPDTTPSEATEVCERLREAVANSTAIAEEGAGVITVSIGISAVTEGVGEGRAAAMERADRRMLSAKEAGRNRVVAA
ncbi:MAG: biofilm regulation diguanylate cyclase SiaD [Pseudomonadota bacterium]